MDRDAPTLRPRPDGASTDELSAAFRELHGARLHGFALLVTMGDQATAARAANRALAEALPRLAELEHPERAAAWLRRRVLESLRGRDATARVDGTRRLAALHRLGVDAIAFAALAPLTLRQRAVLVATSVERLDRHDVATIVGTDGHRLERLERRARSIATASAALVIGDDVPLGGPITSRVRTIAARALS